MLALVVFGGQPATRATTTLTVTSAADDGSAGTLRSVIASAHPGDTVNFDPSLDGKTITLGGNIPISQDLTISGPGANNLTIDGGGGDSIFFIPSGNVQISGLTLQDGAGLDQGGGAIHSNGVVTLTSVVVRNNTSSAAGGGILQSGGSLTIDRSTISGNQTRSNGGGLDAAGGATVTITNSTFANNSSLGAGGAIAIDATGVTGATGATVSLDSATVANNTSIGFGGGVFNDTSNSGTVTLTNTIVDQNSLTGDCSDVSGTFTSHGYNLIGDASCATGFTQPTDHVSVFKPGLGLLADNGGPTPTIALELQPKSPAIGQGTCSQTTDQTGATRVAPCDIGAFAVSPTNYSWTTAETLTPSPTTAVDQYLTRPGQSRWYKFAVQPDTQVTVTLTNLPAEYDLTLYKDIGQAYTQITSPQDLAVAGAEDAPDAFAPDAFAPDAFAPDAFAPDAFAPDAFAPDAFASDVFAPDAFAPDAFAPDAFAPDAFAPDAFAPDAFAPDAFAPDAFAPDAFAAAQTANLIGVSAFPGTGGQGIHVKTWLNTGYFYIRVRGGNGAFNLSQPFHLTVTQPNGACASVASASLPPTSTAATTPPGGGSYTTIILTNPARMAGSSQDKATMLGKLQAFASRTDVHGAIVDVSQDARVAAAYGIADANTGCPIAENMVAGAIKDIVDAYRTANPSLKYVVLVGDDAVIPFFRHPDQATLGAESDFVPPVIDSSAAQASLRLNYFLSQDDYGSSISIARSGDQLPIPQLAVGRLVQTPAEVSGMLDAYTSAGGVVTPHSSLVTGYDFLAPVANQVASTLRSGTGSTPDQLIEANGLSPQDPTAWTANQLRSKLLGSRHDVIFLAGHFNQGAALAADYTTQLFTTDLANSSVNLANSLVFSNGCHSGYSVDSRDDVPNLTLTPDWPEAFAEKQATLIAGTGYQYGDTDFIKYSESIYAGFSQQLLVGTGPVAVGAALMAAKQQYLAQTPRLSGIEAKSVLEITLYGLPMFSVNMPQGRTTPSGDQSIVTSTTPATVNPGQTLGLVTADVDLQPTLTSHTVPLRNVGATGTTHATYLTGSSGEVVEPNEPVLPLEVRNVSVPNEVLRGIGFRAGSYSDLLNILPLTGAATTELRGVHTTFQSPVFFPVQPWRANYFGVLADPQNGATRIDLTAAQYQSSGPASSTGTLRQYSTMQFRLFYSAYTGPSAAAGAPSITLISASSGKDANGNPVVTFSAHVTDDPSAGIQQVWVTYTGDSGTPYYGQWQSLDLVQDTTDSTLWTGTLPLPGGVNPPALHFMVQAASGTGLVALDTNVGAYYSIMAGSSTPLPPPAATTLSLLAPPASGAYGTTVTVSAQLTAGGSPASGQPVTFTLGSETVTGTTGSDGTVAATFQLLDVPGAYQLQARFAGTAALAASSTTAIPFTFTENKQDTTLTMTPGSGTVPESRDAQVTATLTAPGNAPIGGRTVIFLVRGGGTTQSVPASTDPLGRAELGGLTLPPGQYTITAYFGETVPVPSGSIALSDPDYNGASASAMLTIAPSTSLSVAAASGMVGGAITLQATLTSGDVGLSGKTITFTLLGNSFPNNTAPTNAQGVATLANVSLTGINPGSYPSGVGASFAGDTNYSGSSGTGSLTVSPGVPAILTLAPSSQSVAAGTQACVQATVKDTNGNPINGITVRFTVSGVDTATDAVSTTGSGQAQFCYTGQLVGTDTVSAYADTDGNSHQDPGEPGGTASVRWTLPASTLNCLVTMAGSIRAADGDRATIGGLAFTLENRPPTGVVTYDDDGPAQHLGMRSRSVQALVCNGTYTRADLYGTVVLQHTTYTYHITVTRRGRGATYRLLVSNGYDSGTQAVHLRSTRTTQAVGSAPVWPGISIGKRAG